LSLTGEVQHSLTKGQKKLLKKMVESKGLKNISQICDEAGVSTKVYYRMLNHPRLGTLLPEALNYLMSEALLPVLKTVVQKAHEGSAKHAELLFKIGGLIGSDESAKIIQIFKQGETGSFMTDLEIKRLLGSE
jgi:hypothetical protein